MKKWQRKALFLTFLILFVILGPILVLYSLGYRFDFQKKKLTKTGGIFVKAFPKEVEIFIDGKMKKKTDVFFGSALIENLLPKKYRIKISKNGYFSWEKELEIEERRVTEIKGVILFPQNLKFYPILDNVENFWVLPNQKELILKENEENKWSLKLYSLDKKLKSHLISQDNFGKDTEFLNLDFELSADQIEIKVKMKEKEKSYILDIRKSPPLLKEKEEEISPNAVCFKKTKEGFYLFGKDGYLYKEDRKLTSEPLLGIESCQLKIFDNLIFLEFNGNLYFLKEEALKKIFENLKGIEISSDLKKLALFSNYEIWIFPIYNMGPYEKEKLEFLTRFSEKIESLKWIHENYLIIAAEGGIKISEIDKRDKLNVWNVAGISGKKLFFNYYNKKIYIQKENTIFESDPLW